jgi:serine/threonine-protein kinase HipA
MIKVWTDDAEAGLLDRFGARGSTFVYQPDTSPARSVSVTMPVRLSSWDVQYGLHPIFEMNLPEGVLRERLRLAFAKATGTFDEFDLLGIVGRSQVGRLRYTGQKEQLHEDVPFQSVDEILEKTSRWRSVSLSPRQIRFLLRHQWRAAENYGARRSRV